MAKKEKKLTADHDLFYSDLDLDDDLDFNNEIESDLVQESKPGSRNVVTSVLKEGAKVAALDFVSPKNVQSILRKSLPQEYGDITEGIGEVTSNTYQLYDQTVREVKPFIGRIANKVNQIAPENAKRVKDLTKKISEWGGGNNQSYQNTDYTEQAVTQTLSSIFDAQTEQRKFDDAKEVVKDQIDDKRFQANNDLFRQISTDVRAQSQYTISINQSFQRKTLELQLRSYFLQKEFFDRSLKESEITKRQLEVIVKNTGLPEYSKITMSERFREFGKNKLTNSLFGNQGFIKKGFDRLQASAREYVEGFKYGLMNAESALDGIASGKEMLDSMAGDDENLRQEMKISSMGSIAGSLVSNAASNYATDKLKPIFEKDNKLKETLAKGASFFIDPAGSLKKLRDSEKWKTAQEGEDGKSRVARGVDMLLSHWTDSRESGRLGTSIGLESLGQPSFGFDNKARLSLTEVIPLHLSNIHHELTMLRTNKKTDRLEYDFVRKEMVGRKTMSDRIQSALTDDVKSTGYDQSLESLVRTFVDTSTISKDDLYEIKRFFSKLVRIPNFSFESGSVLSNPSFESLSPTAQKALSDHFEALDNAEDVEQRRLKVKREFVRAKKNAPVPRERMDNYVKAGYGEHLAKKGLAKRRDDGTFEIDEDEMDRFVDDNAIIRSDINVKEAIKESGAAQAILNFTKQPGDKLRGFVQRKTTEKPDYQGLSNHYFKGDEKPKTIPAPKGWNPKEAYDAFKKTKLYNWFYKKGEGEEGPQTGPMAQEVNKNFGEETAPGGKMINLSSMGGAMTAAVKHLGEKFDQLKKSFSNTEETIDGKPGEKGKATGAVALLRKIESNTRNTMLMLQGQDKLTRKLFGTGSRGGRGKDIAIPREILHDGTFRGMVLSLVASSMDVGTHIGQSTFRTLKEFFTPGKRTKKAQGLAKDAQKFIADQLTNKDSKTRTSLQAFYNKAVELSTSALNATKNYLDEAVPKSIKFVKDLAQKARDKLSEKINEARDIYIAGAKKPILRAAKIKAGEYYDEVTGKVLLTMDAILKCKNDIVDKAGNIVLSKDERIAGLFTKTGEKISSTLGKVGELAVQYGKIAYNRVKDTIEKLTKSKDGETSGFFSKNWGLNLDFTNHARISSETLIDIRDIMLGRKRDVLRRLKERGSDIVNKAAGTLAKEPTEQKNRKSRAETKPEEQAEQPAVSTGLFDNAKNTLSNLYNKAHAKFKRKGEGDEETTKEGEKAVEKLSILDKLRKKSRNLAASMALATALHGKGSFDHTEEPEAEVQPEAKTEPKPKTEMPAKPSLISRIKQKGRNLAASVALSSALRGKGNLPDLEEKPSQSRVKDAFQKFKSKFKPKASEEIEKNTEPGFLSRMKQKGKGFLASAALATALHGKGKFNEDEDDERKKFFSFTKLKNHLLRRHEKEADEGKKDAEKPAAGSIADRDQKIATYKKLHHNEVNEADLTPRYQNKGNGLLDTLKNGLSFLTSGFGKLFDLIGGGLGKVMGKFGGIITRLLGMGAAASTAAGAAGAAGVGAAEAAGVAGAAGATGAATGILGKAKSLVGATLRGAGRLALNVGKFGLTRALPAVLSGAASLGGAAIGSVASAIGGVIASPVVLGAAAIAAAGYGLYKLYQYATRDDATPYDRIRLRQYGFGYSTNVDRYNHHSYILEAYLQDGRVGYDSGKAYLLDKRIKPEELLEAFNIDPKDDEMCGQFREWFSKRFKPFFLTHMTALYAANPKAKLKDIPSLKPEERLKYLKAVGFEAGPYEVKNSPVKSIELSTDKDFVKSAIKDLVIKIENELAKAGKPITKPIGEKIDTRNLPADKDSGSQTSVEALYAKQNEAARKAAALKNQSLVDGSDQSEDGANAPRTSMPSGDQKASGVGKVQMAPGDVMSGQSGRQYLRLGKGVDINGIDPKMLKLFLGMAEEYGQKTGKSIGVNSGARSYEEQARLHAQDPKKAAPPGRSLHESGLAIDIDSKDADDLERLGLMKKYGFTRPVGGEPWHVEPAGIQRNLELAKTDTDKRAMMVDAGVTHGGGGYGTDPSAIRYKRNNELAMQLLDIPATPTVITGGDQNKPDSLKAMVSTPVVTPGSPGTKDARTVAISTQKEIDKGIRAGAQPTDEKKSETMRTAKASQGSKSKDVVDYDTYANSDSEVKPMLTGGGKSAAVSDDIQSIKETIAKSARRAGEDPNMLQAFAAVESDMNPKARPNNGSAEGLFQWVKDSWNWALGKFGSKYGLGKDSKPTDNEDASLMTAEYIKMNRGLVKPIKPNVSITDMYLMHLLGPGGGRAFLSMADDEIPANRFQAAARSNKDLFFDKSGRAYTKKQIYDMLEKRLSDKALKYGITAPSSGGQGLKPVSNGPGLSASTDTPTSRTTTAGLKPPASAMPAPTPAPSPVDSTPMAGPLAGTQTPKPKARAKDQGLFVDTRAQNLMTGGQSGLTSSDSSISGFAQISSSIDKSIEIQKDAVDILREILEEVKVERVTKALGAVIVAANSGKKDDGAGPPNPKEADKFNLGRRQESGASALDLRRRI